MQILGISAFYHDSAAALVRDGKVIAAAQEERFTRRKHDAAFPSNAVRYCLEAAGAQARDIDFVVFYDKPFLKFERLIETYVACAPAGLQSFRLALPLWVREKLFQKDLLRKEVASCMGLREWPADRLLFTEHHVSHAASAFYPSPFTESLILTMDGVGEWATTSVALGQGRQLSVLKEIHFPHSLGLLYSAFTYYIGFKVNSGEYKLMGLAPYGSPKYAQLIFDKLVEVSDDGSFRLNLEYFEYPVGLTMTNEKFHNLFGLPPRKAEDRLTTEHMDLAASIQFVLEEIVLRMVRSLAAETGQKNLCLAGGVALNCVANGKILRDGCISRLWVQPAAGDAGGALGAALAAYHMYNSGERIVAAESDGMNGAYLGPEYPQDEIRERLRAAGAQFEVLEDNRLTSACVDALTQEKALGWFQGRMEFGPRALGARSILADARSPRMQSTLNLKVKYRESFRPFAPSVLRDHVGEWFEMETDSPYMLLVADVRKEHRIAMTAEQRSLFGIDRLHVPRSGIPAVTHVDYSARVQTVHKETNARYYELIEAFRRRTGCPVIVNASFNVRGEPIVCTPEDAFRCFMGTEIEALAVGNCFLRKEDQNPHLKRDYSGTVEAD